MFVAWFLPFVFCGLACPDLFVNRIFSCRLGAVFDEKVMWNPSIKDRPRSRCGRKEHRNTANAMLSAMLKSQYLSDLTCFVTGQQSVPSFSEGWLKLRAGQRCENGRSWRRSSRFETTRHTVWHLFPFGPDLTSSNKKLLGTSASLLVTSALLVVSRSY